MTISSLDKFIVSSTIELIPPSFTLSLVRFLISLTAFMVSSEEVPPAKVIKKISSSSLCKYFVTLSGSISIGTTPTAS